MKRIERFDKYLSYKGLNDNIVTNDLGLSVGTIGKSRKDGRDLSDRVVELILNFYTDLSRVWLLTGEGEMLIADTTPRIVEASIVSNDEEIEVDIDALMREWHTLPENFANIIGESVDFVRSCKGYLLPRHIIKLQAHYGDAVVDKYTRYPRIQEVEVVESFPVLPEAVAIKPNTDLKEYIEENSSELEQVNPSLLLRSANMAERILRNSMYPTFVPGDIVFVQFLDEESKMNDGEIYYIKSRTRTSMIRQVKFEEGGKIRLIAQNERYADVIMPRCDIINVGTVVGMLRLTFGDQYSEMENLRRTKEDQLNRFIDMQSEMVAEIREQGRRNERERERTDKLIDRLVGR
ncbi:MAG: S24 family peptidase [Alistipes sp.]|nr:S24 family peptidase [Alistipes sp.]